MDPKRLVENLSKWWWMPAHPRNYVNTWEGPPGREAALNLFWVATGRPKTFDFINHIELWGECSRVVLLEIDKRPVEDYVLVLSPPDFYWQAVVKNPGMFCRVPNLQKYCIFTALDKQ